MLRNLGIRWQILSALALPVLVLGLISSQVTYQALVDMREASQSKQLAQAAGGFADLVQGLQSERALSVAVLQKQSGAQAQLKTTRATVDQGLDAIRTQIADADFSTKAKLVFSRAAVSHAELTALRAEVDAGTVESRAAVNRYSRVIDTDIEVPSDLAGTLKSADTAANFQQFSQLSRAGEALAQEQLIGDSAIEHGTADTVDQRDLGAQVASGQLALTAFRRLATTEQASALEKALAAPDAHSSELALARASFQFAGTTGRPTVTQAQWTLITKGQLVALRTALNTVNEDGLTISTSEYKSARTQLQLTLLGAIAIVLITLALALALSRRISAPLRRLTLAATQIRDELPRIVESVQEDDELELHLPVVQTLGSNEVSLLAAAFVDVNAVTVEIAREQSRLRAAVADMFVNIARRNQVLLSRQLSLIDQLERNEVNPDALEELFRLDHLATRMRRNAESLLVLAGIESGRRLREPMPLSDVVRTATSEIEHYSRVTLSLAADPPVYAHLALPIAHLLAEVLENATNFSDPGSAVVVMSSVTSQGIRMTVADDGLGMSAQDLAEINARIDAPPTAEALSSQRLGLFVVGRLAQRLDAKVALTSGRARGTAVLIDLPSSAFVSADSAIPEAPGADRAAAALASVPDQGGSSTRTAEPIGTAVGGTPFVAAFPGAPAVPAAFDSAAFDAVNALEPVWSPQPDNLPIGEESPRIDTFASPTLPARRGGAVATEALVPTQAPAPAPAATSSLPVAEPAAMPVAAPTVDVPTQSSPDWATSDWVTEPAESESAPAIPAPTAGPTPTATATTEAAPIAEPPTPAADAPGGASLFSGFRSSRPTESAPAPAPVAPAPLNPEPDPAPAGFLDSAEAVDGWFDAKITTTPEPEPESDAWAPSASTASVAPSWNDVADETPAFESAPAAAEPSSVSPVADPTPVTWAPETTPEPASVPAEAQAPEPAEAQWAPQSQPTDVDGWSPAADVSTDDVTPEIWTPEPAASVIPEPWEPTPAPTPAAPTPAEPGAEVSKESTATPAPADVTPAPATDVPAEQWAPTPALAEPWAPAVEVWTPEPAPAVEAWTPEPAPAVEAWTPEPAPAVEAWTPEPAPAVEAWTPEPAPAVEAWTPEPAPAVEAWSPEPAPAVEAWTPEPAPAVEAWTPEPAVEAWTPEPAAAVWTPEPTVETWTPEPAVEAWSPEPAVGSDTWAPVPTPEPWTPEPVAETWTPELPQAELPQPAETPAAWRPETNSWASQGDSWSAGASAEAQPEAEPTPGPRPEPKSELTQTLSAAIDILPARTSIRSALGRGRRKNDAQDTSGQPFNGGFDPIAPAREFARREGFGSLPEPDPNGGAPAEATESPVAAGLVPEQPKDSAPFVERRQHPRSSDKSAGGRSALASEALTELSRLSSYSPTSMPETSQSGLQRRTPHDVPVDEQPAVEATGQRARTAASVRSMLAGFKAGVERGRTSPSANRPAELNQPPQPREPR